MGLLSLKTVTFWQEIFLPKTLSTLKLFPSFLPLASWWCLWRNNYHRSLTDLFSYADKFDRLDVYDHSLLVNIESLLIFFQKVFLLGWFTGWIEIQAPTTTTTRSHWQIASSSYCQCNYCLQLPKFLYENSCDGFVPKTLAAFAIAGPALPLKEFQYEKLGGVVNANENSTGKVDSCCYFWKPFFYIASHQANPIQFWSYVNWTGIGCCFYISAMHTRKSQESLKPFPEMQPI